MAGLWCRIKLMNQDYLQDLETISRAINKVVTKIKAAESLEKLEELRLTYLTGKKSLLALASESLSRLTGDEKKKWGQIFNRCKNQLESALISQKQKVLAKVDTGGAWFDVTLPMRSARIGRLSPDTQVIHLMNDFFIYHGYSVAEGPDIETDDYNFERTNLPRDHPARDLQDTIYIESPEILLRTHTSSVETRVLSNHKPPLRFVVPGVSFRNEVINPSNHAIFQQYQGVVVDRGISMANLKETLSEFAKYMFGEDIKTRFRTKYYPEVEPGAGMDVLCSFCHGLGCRICKGRGWLEILGSGMIHRELLKKCGIDFNEWSGFAFGMGLDRIIMTKFGIQDIRDLHGGNLVFV